MSLNPTKIEWVRNPDGTPGYTWNPITGCKNGCTYCYARKMALRFPKAFPNGFKPTFHPERLEEPYKLKKPSTIFVCSMGEIFGDWVPKHWMEFIFQPIKNNPQHTFIILTKCHEGLLSWNFSIFENLWVGITIDGLNYNPKAIIYLNSAYAKVNIMSCEPLLKKLDINLGGIDWLIIGAQTNPYKPPKKLWVQLLIDQARLLGIPIFLKDNLRWPVKIQEFPRG